MLNVPVNNFSVMLGRSHRFLGITSTLGGGGGKYVLLKDTTRRPEWGSNPRPLDPESEVSTTRPPRPLVFMESLFHVLGVTPESRVKLMQVPGSLLLTVLRR